MSVGALCNEHHTDHDVEVNVHFEACITYIKNGIWCIIVKNIIVNMTLIINIVVYNVRHSFVSKP